jgi:hypothetical protein
MDVVNEQMILFSESEKLPTKPSPGSLRNWSRTGALSKTTGEIVILESVQIGCRSYTSLEAFERFWRQLNGDG